MVWRLAEAAAMRFSIEQHCEALLSAQDQLKTAVAFKPFLGVKMTPETEALRAETCLLSYLYYK
jgi:hypothetical protein